MWRNCENRCISYEGRTNVDIHDTTPAGPLAQFIENLFGVSEDQVTEAMQIYSSEIVRIGEQANLFLDEGIVVFGDNPEELQDFAVIHKLEQISGEIVVGTKISLSDSNLEVVSVGPVANENFKNLGHLVLKLDSSTEEAQLGDVRCTFDNKPNIRIGDNLRINN